jgi:hypothetical protein
MPGSTDKRITIQASLGIKRDPIFKITNAKRAAEVVQVVEHLPSKCKTLSSTPRHVHTNAVLILLFQLGEKV